MYIIDLGKHKMKIYPINNTQNHSNFKGLKYLNGIKTENAMEEELKTFLSNNKASINALENVDIIADTTGLLLGIKNIRYLNSKYQRFYDDGKCHISDLGNGNVAFELPSTVSDVYHIDQLEQTESPGRYHAWIYDAVGSYSPENYYNYSPQAILKFAQFLDMASQKIDEAETKYGMDCVRIMEELDKMEDDVRRMFLIDSLNNIYTHEDNILERMETKDLEKLYAYRDIVNGFKYFGINISTTDNFEAIEINDKKGYLDDKYVDLYGDNGYAIVRYGDNNNCFAIAPLTSDYPEYCLFPKNNDNKYRCHAEIYGGGLNLSSMGGDHFDRLIKLVELLEKIGDSIERANNVANLTA